MTLRFSSGGGRPPASHEVLLVDGAAAWYLTGMPWPAQPPFDEIGAYAADLRPGAADHLRELAQACLAAGAPAAGPADAGSESVALDGERVRWSRATAPQPMQRLVAAAREEIAVLRAAPACTLHGTLDGTTVRLVNRGERPLELDGAGELRAGWGRSSRPPSPLRVASRPATTFELPGALAPGAALEAPLPDPGVSEDPETFDALYALVHVRWKPPVRAEGDVLDGWLVAGPDHP